jgi:capsid protein
MGWLTDRLDKLTGASRRERQRIVRQMADTPSISRERVERMAGKLGVQPPESQRRWESAKTDRLNQQHWAHVNGQPINADLNTWLTNLRHRCEYEVANNSLVEGMVNTYQLCCVGSEAPALSIQTANEEYAARRSAIWDEWSSTAGSNQQLSLVEILHLWIRSLFGSGEFFCQLISVPEASPISLRLLPIHAYRCFTPPYMIGVPEVALGVRRDVKNRRPISYLISQPWIYQAYEVYTGQFDEIPYADMIHGYQLIEPDQVRGVPWIASCLDSIAQLRDFKLETLDAARAAADWAVLLTTNHPDSPFFAQNEYTDVERRTIRAMPPGWDAKQMSPAHPGPQFIPFYEAIAREVGGPIAMPLMMLLLDSSSSNYSSARFDGQMFWRGVAKTQGWLGRILARIESLVAREAELMGMLPAAPPDLMRQFVWPRAPHVDPVKEAEAERMALQNGSLSYTQLCAANGTSIERMIAQRKRDNELLKAAGLPEIPGIDSAQKTAEINAKMNNPGDDPPADEDRLPYEQPTSGTPSPPVRKATRWAEVPSVN